ncbi:23S ribosomal RNA methyltransferase [Auriscalpium vulgare]|uniref:23S ribosomal RNA methyltransferase n=1 Tax=Auriscalpium vulgare TaxID=40419 RepID=A0ACB8RLR3_9AGAM|nr:23S ribosomal RNA methyltransferase [Auriscalpium vulgare]
MAFRPTSPALRAKSAPPSSKLWLARHFDDPFVRARHVGADPHTPAFRARSAFKLLDIDDKYRRFLRAPHVRAVVDLGAAPGSWSQVVAGFMGFSDRTRDDPELRAEVAATGTATFGIKESTSVWSDAPEKPPSSRRGIIIAVDRLPMWPIPGVTSLQMDFLTPEASTVIGELLRAHANAEGKADVILSDMAANSTGNKIADTENALDICKAVWSFTRDHLRTAESVGNNRGGVLLIKIFQHPELQAFRKKQLEPHFHSVLYVKPEASRSESSEGYWLCLGFKGP